MTTAKLEKANTSLEKLGAYLSNPVTWKGLAYLLIKFPLGTLSFVVVTTFTAITLTFLAMPIIVPFFNPVIEFWNSSIVIDNMTEASICFVVGLALLFVSLHIFNALAWVSGQFAKIMLGNPGAAALPKPQTVVTAPTAPAVPVVLGEPVIPAEPDMSVEDLAPDSAADTPAEVQD